MTLSRAALSVLCACHASSAAGITPPCCTGVSPRRKRPSVTGHWLIGTPSVLRYDAESLQYDWRVVVHGEVRVAQPAPVPAATSASRNGPGQANWNAGKSLVTRAA